MKETECKLVSDSYAAQTASLRAAAPASAGTHKNPDVKPLQTPNASIKPA
jgi:hypothetical protein